MKGEAAEERWLRAGKVDLKRGGVRRDSGGEWNIPIHAIRCVRKSDGERQAVLKKVCGRGGLFAA